MGREGRDKPDPKAISGRVKYIEVPGVVTDEQRAILDGQGISTSGWYFWNVDWTRATGPFRSQVQAQVRLMKGQANAPQASPGYGQNRPSA